MSDRADWVWMPHAGHLIVGNDCRFHLTTCVGAFRFIVSTVGDYLPDSMVRDILAESRGVALEGRGDDRLADYMKKIGYETVGFDRKYETMVFKAVSAENGCCPWAQESGEHLDMRGYNSPDDAAKGHLELCEEWAAKENPA